MTVAIVSQTINGTDGANTLSARSGGDGYRGLGGPDRITGGAGNDVIDGGDGVDIAEYCGRARCLPTHSHRLWLGCGRHQRHGRQRQAQQSWSG